jgi:hypothetical protein
LRQILRRTRRTLGAGGLIRQRLKHHFYSGNQQ